MQVNVVVMKGINDDELADFVELTRELPINVRFIEYMPFDGNVWSDSKMVTYADMMALVVAAFPQGLERFQVSNWSIYVRLTFDIQMFRCLWGSLSALSHHNRRTALITSVGFVTGASALSPVSVVIVRAA